MPFMDKHMDIEALRARLASMTRAEVRGLAVAAGLSCSTLEKFRLGHIAEPRFSKLQAIQSAINARSQPSKARRDPKPAVVIDKARAA
jgi:hypothetical protein